MPKGYPPSVFVSSTCYDLNQIRIDLKDFFTEMGLEPILSESSSFPVTPNVSPVDNCLKAVKERADIFVMIIGARYGTQTETGKSVTNLEYLEAKSRGLPIYIFVESRILNIFPVWKENKTGNYGSVIDTPKLFEFIELLYGSRDHWIYEFKEVKDVIERLRKQFAILFTEGLLVRERLKELNIPPALSELSGKPLRLLLERPTGWEFFLFTSVLRDGMNSFQDLKWDLKYGLKIQKVNELDIQSAMSWIGQKLGDLMRLTDIWRKIMNSILHDAFREPGIAGDPEQIVYAARRLSGVYKSLLEWTIEFNSAQAPEIYAAVLALLSQATEGVIEKIELTPSAIDAEITKAAEMVRNGGNYSGGVHFTLDVPPCFQEICREIERIGLTIQAENL